MARQFLLDTSALVKRYSPEIGTALLNHLFANVAPNRMACMLLNTLEVASVLVRKKNRGDIPLADFQQAMSSFHVEIVNNPAIQMLSASDSLLRVSIPYIDHYAINANDAVLLTAMKILVQRASPTDEWILFVSDQRLFKAAQAEGFTTFNPETQTQAELDALIPP